MDQYSYSKDTRTDSEYKNYVDVGVENQKRIMDKLNQEYAILWVAVKNNETFTKDFVSSYEPDVLIGRVKDGSCGFAEVKASKYLPDQIDFKKNQIDELVRINGIIIYATADLVILDRAKTVQNNGWVVDEKESKVHKQAYRVEKSKLSVFSWKNRLDLLDYKVIPKQV